MIAGEITEIRGLNFYGGSCQCSPGLSVQLLMYHVSSLLVWQIEIHALHRPIHAFVHIRLLTSLVKTHERTKYKSTSSPDFIQCRTPMICAAERTRNFARSIASFLASRPVSACERLHCCVWYHHHHHHHQHHLSSSNSPKLVITTSQQKRQYCDGNNHGRNCAYSRPTVTLTNTS